VVGSTERARSGIQPWVTALLLQNFLHHISGGAAGHILVHEKNARSFFERVHDHVIEVKRQQSLNVDQLHVNTNLCQSFSRLLGNAHGGSVGHQGQILSFPEHFRHTERKFEFREIVWQAFLETVAIQNFDDQGRIIPFD